MRNYRAFRLSMSAAMLLGVVGCSEESSVKEQTKITTPDGTATITKDTKVETSGKNPPVVAAPTTSSSPTPAPKNP